MIEAFPTPVVILVAVTVGIVGIVLIYQLSTWLFSKSAQYLPGVNATALQSIFGIPMIVSVGLLVSWIGVQSVEIPTVVRPYVTPIFWTMGTLVWFPSLLRGGKLGIQRAVETDRIEGEIAPIVQNVWTITILLTTAGFVLSIWDIDVTPLLASAGVLGIVLGFAARETIANFLASLALYADDTYQAGDYIRIESENVAGYVHDITIRSTTLATLDGNHVTIPNSKLNDAVITNLSAPQSLRRIHLHIGVEYGVNPDRVKEILTEVLTNTEQVESEPQPQIHLREFEASAILFEVLAWINRPRDALLIEDELNVQIYEALTAAGIEIPYPQHDVRFPDGVQMTEDTQADHST